MLCGVIGCGGAQASADHAPVTEESASAETQPVADPVAEPATAGRMAFAQCDAEQRPTVCTKEHRPVCAEVDNGVRCITTPCGSTDQRNFSNACMACANANVVGHWPVACESLGIDAH